MKRAWVITQEGTQHQREVLSILSARESINTIKKYVEWLYNLFNSYPTEHLAAARYKNPTRIYKAETEECHSFITCGHNPFLVARLARNVALIDPEAPIAYLQWTEPDRFERDSQSLQIVKTIPGEVNKAPVHLPMRVSSQHFP